MRKKGGGKSFALSLGWGDLLVMGGTCQRTYDHAIPKVAEAAARVVILLRPEWSEREREGADLTEGPRPGRS